MKVSYVLCAVQRLFFTQLTATPKYSQILERTRKCTQTALSEVKDVVDFNFAVLNLLQTRLVLGFEIKLNIFYFNSGVISQSDKKDRLANLSLYRGSMTVRYRFLLINMNRAPRKRGSKSPNHVLFDQDLRIKC